VETVIWGIIMGKIEIYYFSGTGNSLHVAKELKKRFSEASLIPIVKLLNKDRIETNAETVGFVFPIHFANAPAPVIKFLKKLELKLAQYIFAVATRAGSQHRAFIEIENILKRKNKTLDAFFTLNMADNDPKFEAWHPATPEELEKIESEVQKKLDTIQKIILNKEKSREKDTEFIVPTPAFSILSQLLPILNRMQHVEFYSDSKCAGCGTCEKVCLSGKVKIVDGKPIWQKDVQCFFCYACLNFCPKQAIQIRSTHLLKSHTQENERYSHPYATVNDIAEQKNEM
jgi:ferredoxin